MTFILLLICFFGYGNPSIEPSPEERGRQIFEKGTNASGTEIIALMSGIEIPASVLPCAGCHGMDGKGKPEGGVTPSNITWHALKTDYEGIRKNGRNHPAYTTKTLKRAITMGLDPKGNKLHNTMPKYQMSLQDMDDLMAYIKVLGSTKTTGVTDTSIHIGWIPFLKEKFPKVEAVQKKITTAIFEEINQKGGIYNRKIYLKNYTNENNQDSPKEDIFALTGSALFANQAIATKPVNIENNPFIGAISNYPDKNNWNSATTFYAYPNLKGQIDLLAEQVQRIAGIKKPLAILVANTPLQKALAEPFKQKDFVHLVKEIPTTTTNFTAVIQELQTAGVQSVLLLLDGNLETHFFQTFSKSTPPFDIILPGTQTQQSIFDLPPHFDHKILLVYPFWNSVISPEGKQIYQQLQQKYQLSPQYQQSQMVSLSTATLIIEAIKACGQALTPEILIENLEDFYKLKTNWSPPMTFTPNRHTGITQVFVLRYQGKTAGFLSEQ